MESVRNNLKLGNLCKRYVIDRINSTLILSVW